MMRTLYWLLGLTLATWLLMPGLPPPDCGAPGTVWLRDHGIALDCVPPAPPPPTGEGGSG